MSLTRGAIWLADLSPTRGHEQAGRRPVLLVSPESFNRGPSTLVIICPLTTTERGIRTHIKVLPTEGGLKEISFVMTEAVRSISKDRLVKHWGNLTHQTMNQVSDVLKILMDLR
ncbi:MAG: type II toxin-antitoxin system PemK/MazF family toxin [Vulcanimicrobiota bacterium]